MTTHHHVRWKVRIARTTHMLCSIFALSFLVASARYVFWTMYNSELFVHDTSLQNYTTHTSNTRAHD